MRPSSEYTGERKTPGNPVLILSKWTEAASSLTGRSFTW
jgi:hypothetical protein